MPKGQAAYRDPSRRTGRDPRDCVDTPRRTSFQSGRQHLVNQNVPAPAVSDGGVCIPDSVFVRPQFFYQCHVVVPGYLCKHRLHKFFLRPKRRQRLACILDFWGKAAHLGEIRANLLFATQSTFNRAQIIDFAFRRPLKDTR